MNIITLDIYEYFIKDNIKVEIIPAVSSFDYVINIIMKRFRIRSFEFSLFFYPMDIIKYDSIEFNNSIIFNLNSLKKYDKTHKEEFINFIFKKFNKSDKLYLISYDFLKHKEYIKKDKIARIDKIIDNVSSDITVFIP